MHDLRADVLGKIVLMQSTIQVLPNTSSLASFLSKGFSEVPGIKKVTVCLQSSCERQENISPDQKKYKCHLGVDKDTHERLVCPLDDPIDIKQLPVQTSERKFGQIIIEADNQSLYEKYEPYICNTANLVALLLENREQNDEMEAINQNLEMLVEHRTKELTATNIQLHNEIDEKWKAEEALLRSEVNLRITLNSIGEGVIATDIKGKITTANPVVTDLTGYSTEEVIGKPLHEVFKVADDNEEDISPINVSSIIENDQTVTSSHQLLVSRDGNKLNVSYSISPIKNVDKIGVGVVVIFRDITEKVTLEKELQQTRKMDSIGQLAGGIAHDFNNMLSGIVGAAELLAHNLTGDTYMRYVNIIIDSAEKSRLPHTSAS